MAESQRYEVPGVLTEIDETSAQLLVGFDADPPAVARVVRDLVIQPWDAQRLGLPAARLEEKNLRSAKALLGVLGSLDRRPLIEGRDPQCRVVGTCRHFALLSCALLRHQAVAARVRCGFATYFQPGVALDHWICEYRDSLSSRWVRVDAEVMDRGVVERPEDLKPGSFLSGGEAWSAYRAGEVDPSTFGVHGTQNWGANEIRGNVIKDLAALNKVEMLPWDEWGRMTDMYQGRTGPDYDNLIDQVALACVGADEGRLAGLYGSHDLAVPAALLRE